MDVGEERTVQQITIAPNSAENESEGIAPRWRKLPMSGIVQILCPLCFEWFRLGPDFHITPSGLIKENVHHICESEKDNKGWVFAGTLEDWDIV